MMSSSVHVPSLLKSVFFQLTYQRSRLITKSQTGTSSFAFPKLCFQYGGEPYFNVTGNFACICDGVYISQKVS